MIGYKDMTWCTYDKCALTHSCWRYFTPEDHEKAVKWWGSEDYSLVIFSSKPKCFVDKNKP